MHVIQKLKLKLIVLVIKENMKKIDTYWARIYIGKCFRSSVNMCTGIEKQDGIIKTPTNSTMSVLHSFHC